MEFVAADILSRTAGDRIKTISEYQDEIGVGSGTVQKTLSALEGLGAVALTRHGHQGTRITEMSRGSLWGLTGRGQVRIVSTLPGAIDAFGLIKGLESQLTAAGIPVGMRYRRSADVRARSVVKDEADIAIMSRGAARKLPPRLRRRTSTIEMSPGSYYAPGSVVRLARSEVSLSDGRVRVGVDPASHDHSVLTDAEFPEGDKRWVRVDCPYTHLPAALVCDEVDVGVWHRTLLSAPLGAMGLVESPLASAAADDVLREVSPAVLLVRADDRSLGRLLEAIDMRAVLRAERALLAMDPESPQIHEAVWSR